MTEWKINRFVHQVDYSLLLEVFKLRLGALRMYIEEGFLRDTSFKEKNFKIDDFQGPWNSKF